MVLKPKQSQIELINESQEEDRKGKKQEQKKKKEVKKINKNDFLECCRNWK